MKADVNALARARLFAALSGPFEPKEALLPFIEESSDSLAMTATELAEVCDTKPLGAGTAWLMRAPVRIGVLKSLGPQALAEAITQRRAKPVSPETEDLLCVLGNKAPFDRQGIRKVIQNRSDRAALERVITALDRAGEVAPTFDLLQPARSALAEHQRSQNLRRVAERGFFGRKAECDQIEAWLSHSVIAPPVTCLFISGAPGIGKSTLLAESVRRQHERSAALILRLDFDRAGLDVQDQLGLTMEAARQITDQLGNDGAELATARLMAGRVSDPGVKQGFASRQGFPQQLAMALGAAVTTSQRAILVVLDTLEVLRGRGETRPEALFRWLDRLVELGVRPMHVLAAGRGDALDTLRTIGDSASNQSSDSRAPRVKRMELSFMEDEAAIAMLERIGAQSELYKELLDIAQGNPLKLRLAAEIVKRSGTKAFPKRKRGKALDAAFLYRMLLSRIDEVALRRLAHPGLIVRRINADVVRYVLAPTLGFGTISQERAQELLKQLATHHWLVEQDTGAPGYLKHRSDMRSLLLPLLYRSAPAQAARVDSAAKKWFMGLDEPWARVEAAYHELQLSRVGNTKPPTISVSIASQFDEASLLELSPVAADSIRSLRGERTSQFRGSQSTLGQRDDAQISQELIGVVQRQDWQEGGYLVRSIMADGQLDATSRSADAIRTYLWRSGQWSTARRWLADRDRYRDSDEDLQDMPDELALARLEMRAQFDPEKLRRKWKMWKPLLPRLERAARSATDSVARDGALALLCANLPDPFHFARAEAREINLAVALEEQWANGGGQEAGRALEAGAQRIRQALSVSDPTGEKQLSGRVLATLTPYTSFAANLTLPEEQIPLRDAAAKAVRVIVSSGQALIGPSLQLSMVPPSSSPVHWLASVGLFAEWAGAYSYLFPEGDIRQIGFAAERWRRTAGGDWSVGRRRGAWRARPLLDEVLASQVAYLLGHANSVQQAYEHLDMWGNALSTESLIPLLRQRLRRTLLRESQEIGDDPQRMIRRLMARGAPSAFAPALLVLAMHRKL